MNHNCDHALKYYYQNKKVKRDHNQTIKTLLLIEDLFSSAGKIGIPVKWIAFWPDVSGGEELERDEPPVRILSLLLRNFICPRGANSPDISV